MIVVKREVTEDETDAHHPAKSAVNAMERHQQQAQKRIRNRDDADETATLISIKTKSTSFYEEDVRARELLSMDETTSAAGSHPSHSPPTVKTESRHHSPSATSVSSSVHHGVRSWSSRSSPNGHTSNINKTIRPEIIFSHRRASATVCGTVSMDASPTGGCRTSPPHTLPAGSSPDRHQNGSNKQLNTSSAPTNARVPSVILGQSGGVKTMVWTGHWADQQPTLSRPRSVPNSDVQQPLIMAVHQNRPVGKQNNLQDAASIRLSIDGLLSLAQSSDRRHGNVSRSSPLQVNQLTCY